MIKSNSPNKIRVAFLSILLVFSLTSLALATTYYVSTSGNDANPGTSTQPWKTITKAANTMAAGDTVIVNAGTYSERVQITKSGSSGASITYQTQDTVVMKGFTVLASYITIKGFEITDTPDNWREGIGIWVQGSYNIIENNYVYYCTWGGIQLYATPSNATVTTNCIVRNNRLDRNSQYGITVNGRNHLVEGNEISGTIQYHPNMAAPPSWVDADGIRFFGSGHVFRKNSIHDITYTVPENKNPHIDCFQTFDSSNTEVASDTLFEQNFCKVPEMQSRLVQGSGFTMEGTGSPVRNITIRNNIINSIGGVYSAGTDYLTIVNNVFIGKLNPGDVRCLGVALYKSTNYDSTNAVVKNNIFYDVGQGYTPTAYIDLGGTSAQTLDAGYNDIYMSDGTNPPKGSPYPSDLWKVNPLFADAANDDYHLKSSSPCIDSGYNLSSLVSNDYDGNTRPQGAGFDIGAYEFVSGSPNRPPPPKGLRVIPLN